MQILKQKRLIDPSAIEAVRKSWCEYCGEKGLISVHHIKTRGSRGDDIRENLISLGEWCGCHTKAHNAQISKAELWGIVGEREGMSADEAEGIVRRVKAWTHSR